MDALGFEGKIIENHDTSPYEIVEGAYGIWQLSKFCKPGTVHLGVVDPGVGSDRAGIVIKTKNFWFVGPDNGLLYPAAKKDGVERIWKLKESEFGEVAKTFHGRDVFIKAAVYLAQGKKPEDFRAVEYKNELTKLDFVHGQILHIDRYGNVKFFWEDKAKPGDNVLGIPVVLTFSDVEPGKALILNGSSQMLELTINKGDARNHFRLKLGQDICKSFI